jgi:CRISPR-associated protein (TIGR03985 family)
VLESVSFVQPNLEVVVRSLWEQVTDISPTSPKLGTEPQKRIFLHLDYILSPEKQESVDTYQEQLESLWHRHEGGIVQFKYWIGIRGKKSSANRVPRLPALRATRQVHERLWYRPKGEFGWHNYRLDRIASKRLTVLGLGRPQRSQTPQRTLAHRSATDLRRR